MLERLVITDVLIEWSHEVQREEEEEEEREDPAETK